MKKNLRVRYFEAESGIELVRQMNEFKKECDEKGLVIRASPILINTQSGKHEGFSYHEEK